MKNDYLSRLFNLKGKVALVTGATGQLGETMCQAYLQAGMGVIGVDKKLDPSRMTSHKNIQYIVMDITKKNSVKEGFRKIYSKHDRLDVLVNNAGTSVFEPFEKRSEKSFDLVMDVNLKGTFFCIQAYAQWAQKRKQDGNIINIASIYGVISPDSRIYTDCKRRNSEVYGATKAGVIQMTRYFAVHLAPYKIRVNCISPGGIFNPRLPQGKDFITNYSYRCPMGRMANVCDIMGALLYLSSEASSYTNGQNMVIDGGMSCW
ncbi:MAG: SDR family oxidoreductase [Candidatus Omnitrophota bacterium]|nr:SDR family oxidoreductase [Candidatus Omnitrophota bacterium]